MEFVVLRHIAGFVMASKNLMFIEARTRAMRNTSITYMHHILDLKMQKVPAIPTNDGMPSLGNGDFDDHPRPISKPQASQGSPNMSWIYSIMGSGLLMQLFGPEVQKFFRVNPRLMKLVMRGFMGYGLISYLQEDFLPSAYFRFDDQLYRDLCKFVLDKESRFSMSWPPGDNTSLVQSTEYRRNRITPEIWWPARHEGEKDVYYEKYGTRLFHHNGTLFMLVIHPIHRRHSMPSTGQATLKALALNDKPIKALLQEVWDTRHEKDGERTTHIFTVQVHGFHGPPPQWDLKARKPARELESVNINKDGRDRLLADCSSYLADGTKKWYQQRGIPYRRGYLFHGAPGTGKSSLALALAGYFKLDIFTVSLATPGLLDSDLINLFQELSEHCILLLEDIDSAGLTREGDKRRNSNLQEEAERPDSSKQPTVTLSGLLNALDGAAAPEGHILIMSTNHPENIDPALIRAGRIDYDFEFRLADRQMTKDIFLRIMKDDAKSIDAELLQQAELFASRIPEHTFAPAALQGYLLDHKGNIDKALTDAEEWVQRGIAETAEKAKQDAENKKAKGEAEKKVKRNAEDLSIDSDSDSDKEIKEEKKEGAAKLESEEDIKPLKRKRGATSFRSVRRRRH